MDKRTYHVCITKEGPSSFFHIPWGQYLDSLVTPNIHAYGTQQLTLLLGKACNPRADGGLQSRERDLE